MADRHGLTLSMSVMTLLIVGAGGTSRADGLPAGLVFLADVDATIVQDMRYASKDNFMARPLPGYLAPECVLKQSAAVALKRVQQDLAAKNMSLKMFDCYRPVRAVQAMVQWVKATTVAGDASYFPRTSKSALIAQGYIAARSGHSTGTVVDLTLTKTGAVERETTEPAIRVSCLDLPGRSGARDLDMGTSFDCFDPKSATASAEVSNDQRQRRNLLVGIMQKNGFSNYAREWWHFSFRDGASSVFDFDIPVRVGKIVATPSEQR